ncbi:MAG: hypothetical protein SFV54_10955 [Bryobacteraceae bacterium]|nr:hypothetical protein [Bryobacteraceae bacterium]
MSAAVLGGKVAIGLLCWLVVALAWRSRWWQGLPVTAAKRWGAAAVVVSRVGLFVLLYLIMGFEAPSDVGAAYYPEALAALEGKVVYREIATTYAPLFPYIAALPVLLWNSGKAIVLLAIAFEIAGYLLWTSFLERRVKPEQFRAIVLLYACSPLLFGSVVMGGQNHVWISPFLALSLKLTMRGRRFLSGLVSGAAFVATKFFVALLYPGLLFSGGRWVRFIAGVAVLPALVYGVLLAAGVNILYPLQFQRMPGQESSGNLPYLLSGLGVAMTSPVYVGAALVLLALLSLILLKERAGEEKPDSRLTTISAVAAFAIALLLSKKSYTTYWASVYVPLLMLWTAAFLNRNRAWVHIFQFWGLVACVEPSLFFRWFRAGDLSAESLQLVQVEQWQLAVFLACQAVLISFNAGLLWLSATRLLRLRAPAAGDGLP